MGQVRMGQHIWQHSTSGRALRDENKASAPYDLLARGPTEVVGAIQPIACTFPGFPRIRTRDNVYVPSSVTASVGLGRKTLESLWWLPVPI